MKEIPVDELRRLLSYDPETGALTWLYRPREMFKTDQSFGMWNTRYAGKPAFTYISHCGYHEGAIHNARYKAHRVAWALHTGEWPSDQIDHINGCKTDNRITNLRVVSQADNCKNQKIKKNNTSGYTGVYWHKREQQWYAQIRVNGSNKFLGYFTNLDAAVIARTQADIDYGFHPGHGARR